MIRTFLNSKIHKATVTDSRIDYEGSCEIDISLLNACGINPYEKIDLYNISNVERLSTYAIAGKAESGVICVNGAACHKIKIKHKNKTIKNNIEVKKTLSIQNNYCLSNPILIISKKFSSKSSFYFSVIR